MEGLEKLSRELEEASRAFKSLDGDIAQVRVVPGDDASVQAAIRQIVASRVATIGLFFIRVGYRFLVRMRN